MGLVVPGLGDQGIQHPGKTFVYQKLGYKPRGLGVHHKKLGVEDRKGGQVVELMLDPLIAQHRGLGHGSEAVVVGGPFRSHG